MAPSIRIPEYYANKKIFITGATGFMGKVLVEKLLRCCPDIDTIYLLMRSKRGQNSKERLGDFVNCRVFEKLKSSSFEKLRLIPGDILVDGLGITTQDREELSREAQIIFHCAACVRFDMPLRDALNLNTVGTKRVLELAEGMTKLEVFLHVSTAYSRCELDLLEEKVYPSVHRPQNVMDCVKWMDEPLIRHVQTELIKPQPNTYAYTKSLTEDLVAQYAHKFPIAIARPSIVTAAYKEPMPGWVDNFNGPTGLLIGAGKGVIRTMHCNASYKADIIPVDIVVNGVINLAYVTGMEQSKEIKVVNVTESSVNPITWGESLDIGRVYMSQYPFSVCAWYPGGGVRSSRLAHTLALFLHHLLPAYLLDGVLMLIGKKTFMVKIQKKISYGLEVLQYYTTKEWYFKNDNFLALRKKLREEDDQIFYTDMKVIDWNLYIRDYIKGAREFCCKDDPSTLPQARRLHKQLYVLDKVTTILIYSLLAYFIYYYIISSIINVLN